MKTYLSLLSILLMSLSVFGVAASPLASQYDDDDDIYFNPSKAKKQPKVKVTKQTGAVVVEIPSADTYAVLPGHGVSIDVDSYNRRGVFAVPKDSVATSGLESTETFRQTRNLERFHNPDIILLTDDDELADLYYTQPSSTVNICLQPSTPSYNLYWGYPYSSYSYYRPYSWYWPYDPYYSWGWRPYWSYNWYPGWAWNPSYSWGWGPSWGWSHGWGWGGYPHWTHTPSRPNHAAGNIRPGQIAHSSSNFRPGNTVRPSSTNNTYRPGNTNTGYRSGRGTTSVRPGNSNVRSNTSVSTTRTQTGNNSYRPSNTNTNNNNSYRSNTPSYRSSGSTPSYRSSGSGSAGSRGGGGRGRH